jgi:hypothetical protein
VTIGKSVSSRCSTDVQCRLQSVTRVISRSRSANLPAAKMKAAGADHTDGQDFLRLSRQRKSRKDAQQK